MCMACPAVSIHSLWIRHYNNWKLHSFCVFPSVLFHKITTAVGMIEPAWALMHAGHESFCDCPVLIMQFRVNRTGFRVTCYFNVPRQELS